MNLVLATMVLIAVVLMAPSVQASRYKRCAEYEYRGVDGDGPVFARTYELSARRTTCRAARRVAAAFLSMTEGVADPPTRFRGFRCARSNTIVITCRRRAKRVRWYTENRFG